MTSLKELRAEVERKWAIELEARRAAAAAEKIWRAALKEHYGEKQLEEVDLRGCET